MDDLRQKLEPLIPQLRRYARALLCDATGADELLQDCLQRAIRRWPQRRSAAESRIAVFTILHHLALSHLRERARRPVDIEVDGWVRPVSGVAHRQQSPWQHELLSALAALPDEERSVVLLVGVEGSSYAEAATVLALPLGTLMTRLSRGRERLLRTTRPPGQPGPPSGQRPPRGSARSALEDDVNALIDGALAPERRVQLEAALRADPDLALRVEDYVEQRQGLCAALDPIALEPLPPELDLERLLAARPPLRRSRPSVLQQAQREQAGELEQVPLAPVADGTSPAVRERAVTVQPRVSAATLRLVLGAVLLLGGGAAAGWALRAGSPPVGIAALAREAADSYRVYAADGVRPVELRAAEAAALEQWVSVRLGHRMVAPDLAASGYRFMGGRLVPTPEGPAALFMYDDERGARVMLLARPLDGEREAAVSDRSQSGLSGFAWATDGVGYSLVGHLPRRVLEPLARELRVKLAG